MGENNTAPNNGKRMATEAELQGNAVIYAALCYVCPLWLIGLLASPEKDSAFVKNHVNCGILLSIAGVASGVIAGILALIPVVGWILAGLVPVALLVVAILGIVAAVQKEYFTIFGLADKLQIIK